METTHASLLIRIRDRGDAAAWSEFDAVYRPMLRRFARARGLQEAEVEDVVQHAMLAVSEYIARFEYDPTRGRFKGWLRTIVNNRVRSLLSARADRQAETADLKRPSDTEPSPDDLFDQVWMSEHLRHCLDRLRGEVEPLSWQAFEAYVLNDQPVEEVMRSLGVSANQLYSIKFRLTRKLAEHMERLAGSES